MEHLPSGGLRNGYVLPLPMAPSAVQAGVTRTVIQMLSVLEDGVQVVGDGPVDLR